MFFEIEFITCILHKLAHKNFGRERIKMSCIVNLSGIVVINGLS